VSTSQPREPGADERELDALLARDGRVRAAWREASSDEPPAALDDAIRAAARRAVRARPRPAEASFTARWRVPVSIAALLLVSATLTLLLSDRGEHLPSSDLRGIGPPRADKLGADEPKADRPRTDQPTAEMPSAGMGGAAGVPGRDTAQSDAPAREAPPLAPRAVAESAQGAAAKPVQGAAAERARGESRAQAAVRSPEERALAKREVSRVPEQDAVSAQPRPFPQQQGPAPAQAEAPAEAQAAAPVAAEGRAQAGMRSKALADRSMPPASPAANLPASDGQTAAEAKRSTPPPPTAAPAAAARSPASPAASRAAPMQAGAQLAGERAEPTPATRAEIAAGDAGAAQPLEPQAWIEHILALRREGRMQEARRSLEAFRRRYPDFRLPPELASPPPPAAVSPAAD
jgi:hypothetical protein